MSQQKIGKKPLIIHEVDIISGYATVSDQNTFKGHLNNLHSCGEQAEMNGACDHGDVCVHLGQLYVGRLFVLAFRPVFFWHFDFIAPGTR